MNGSSAPREMIPFPYQRRFAKEGEIPNLVDVPTGLGKTAMAVIFSLLCCAGYA